MNENDEAKAEHPVHSAENGKTLAELEQIVKDGERSFVTIGSALRVIRDEALYVDTHADFDAYCAIAFDRDSSYVSRVILAATTAKRMEAAGITLANEGQAREVRKIMDQPGAPADASIAVVVQASVILTGRQTAKGISDTFRDMDALGVALGRKSAQGLADALDKARKAKAKADAALKERNRIEAENAKRAAEALRNENARDHAAKGAEKPKPKPTPEPKPFTPVVHEGGADYDPNAPQREYASDMLDALLTLSNGGPEEWLLLPTVADDRDELLAMAAEVADNIKAMIAAVRLGVSA